MTVQDISGQPNRPSADLPLLLREFLLPIAPPPTLLELLRASGDEKRRVRELLPLIERNPATWHLLMKLTFLANKVKDWQSEVPENEDNSAVVMDRILGLLGKDLIRNLGACMAMNRITGANVPRKNKDTSVNISYADQLPFALLAQEYCADRKLMHSDMAFNAGLHYDWISTLLNKRKASQDQKALVKESFDEGFLMARVSYRLAQKMGKVKHDRFVFAGALLVPIGKVLMSVLYPKDLKERSWAQLVADCDKHPKGRLEALDCYEPVRFAITSAEISSLVASHGQTIRPVERAICHITQPYYLDSIDPALGQLSGLWSVARAAALTPGGKFTPSTQQLAFLKKANLPLETVKKVAAEAREEKVG